jgi:hypothetical protein
MATSSLPLQSVALYRYSVNGIPQQGVSVPATPPSSQFSSPATYTSGVAIANPTNSTVPIYTAITDDHGTTIQYISSIRLAAHGHYSANFNQISQSAADPGFALSLSFH